MSFKKEAIEKQAVENVFIKGDSSSSFFIKLINPLLTKIVGSVASVLFQHISYWSKTQKTNTVFRTNDELVSDLQGMYTASQIQYAKKKLIDNGMIEVSFNKGKKSWDRTTHYSITENGKQYLISSKVDVDTENTPKHSDSEHSKVSNSNDSVSKVKISHPEPKVPKTSVKHAVVKANVVAKTNNAAANTKDMKESFSKGFSNENAVKCPDDILDKVRGLLKKKHKQVNEYQTQLEDSVVEEVPVMCDQEQFNSDILDNVEYGEMCADEDALFSTVFSVFVVSSFDALV